MIKERVQKLEETVAHQDQQIADLSEMLILQAREIAKLERETKRLHAKIETIEDENGSESENAAQSATEFAAQNKPPHY